MKDSLPDKPGKKEPKKIFIISPCHPNSTSEAEFNIRFAECIARDTWLKTGAIPIAPHLYFISFLVDMGAEREFGIEAGHTFMKHCDSAVCAIVDGNISNGMKRDLTYATDRLGLTVEFRHFTKKEALKFIMETEYWMCHGRTVEHR